MPSAHISGFVLAALALGSVAVSSCEDQKDSGVQSSFGEGGHDKTGSSKKSLYRSWFEINEYEVFNPQTEKVEVCDSYGTAGALRLRYLRFGKLIDGRSAREAHLETQVDSYECGGEGDSFISFFSVQRNIADDLGDRVLFTLDVETFKQGDVTGERSIFRRSSPDFSLAFTCRVSEGEGKSARRALSCYTSDQASRIYFVERE